MPDWKWVVFLIAPNNKLRDTVWNTKCKWEGPSSSKRTVSWASELSVVVGKEQQVDLLLVGHEVRDIIIIIIAFLGLHLLNLVDQLCQLTKTDWRGQHGMWGVCPQSLSPGRRVSSHIEAPVKIFRHLDKPTCPTLQHRELYSLRLYSFPQWKRI